MKLAERVSADPAICHGKPVIAGTRVLVSVLVGEVASGAPLGEVAEQYGVTHDDVVAALSYAAQVVSGEQYRAA